MNKYKHLDELSNSDLLVRYGRLNRGDGSLTYQNEPDFELREEIVYIENVLKMKLQGLL